MAKRKGKRSQEKRQKSVLPTTKGEQKQRPVILTDRYDMIAEAAYFIAEHRGFGAGHELEDWLQAEKEVDTLHYLGQF